jgi:hypothetical protein
MNTHSHDPRFRRGRLYASAPIRRCSLPGYGFLPGTAGGVLNGPLPKGAAGPAGFFCCFGFFASRLLRCWPLGMSVLLEWVRVRMRHDYAALRGGFRREFRVAIFRPMYANAQRPPGGARILVPDGGARASDAAGFARRAARRYAPVAGAGDESKRLVGGKIQFIDADGKVMMVDQKKIEPAIRFQTYGAAERLDPGQDASQGLDVEFPAAALKAKQLKEIRLELTYIPSPYKADTVNFAVSIGGQ